MACERCDGTGWQAIDRDGVRRVERCACWQDRVTAQLLEAARIPPRYARCTLENFLLYPNEKLTTAISQARKFADAFPAVQKGLCLIGPPGIGKTHIAVSVLRRLVLEKQVRGLFYDVRDLLRVIRSTYNPVVRTAEMDILRPVMSAELLVLDDLGAEKTSEWVQETLGLVINSRYNARRPTIITTNLQDDNDSTNPNSFMFQIGARTRSRLVEMCEWVQIEGADERDKDREAAAARAGEWPAPPDNIKKPGLPQRTRGQARANVRDRGPADLKWTGGKAGS